MEIAEPMTMITDYIVTIYTFVLAILLFINFSYTNHPAVWYLGITLVITGIGALLGGSAHGFKPSISEKQHNFLWKGTTISLGFAAFFLLLASIKSSSSNSSFITSMNAVAVLQLMIYLYWIRNHDEFLYVIVNYLFAMILVVILKIYSFITIADQSSIWILGSIIVSIVASGIQAKKIGIHPKYFNHNDLFHVIQLPGFYLLYKAAFFLPHL